ncbi:MAG: hypothetical protein GW809_05065 [Bacteroidetes bacterium]|nr:hypothetical protein [Bacteroidota bacterium]NCQ11508.1 hypothetical protein [Bacteroidota bacterium]
MSPILEYETRIDSKKRITIRGAKATYYHVTERADGTIELSPRILVHPDEISEKTLNMIDKSAQNIKNGVVSKSVDLQGLHDLIDK